jgi:phenylalanyl-tRNA synthetase beta chain
VTGDAIELRTGDVERILGLAIPQRRIAEHLQALGCTVVSAGAVARVTPPAWRLDLTIAADLIEAFLRNACLD